MSNELAAEFRKLWAGRGLLYTVGIGLGLIVMAGVGTLQTVADQGKTGAEAAEAIVRQGFAGLLFATIAGSLLVTNEYRHRTWTRTYLTTPRRDRVLAAKALVALLAGIPVGLLSVLASTLVAVFGGHTPTYSADMVRLTVMIVAISALAGPWGVALGYLIRNQVATVMAVVAYTTGIEAVLIVVAPSFGRFLPGGAQLSLLHDPELTMPLQAWAAAAMLLGYILVALTGALRREKTAEAH
ncbi:ABC transporter permease [Streptomyces sp. NPDC006463]|uniref:ABC transporter permease n=1 Tax=Streptomyces sp. NPDC006463 TaxID=3364746 RepID=UPI0036BCB4C6